MSEPNSKLLGDYLGSLRYFGQCYWCGLQFMSQGDRVWFWTDYPWDHLRFCSAKHAKQARSQPLDIGDSGKHHDCDCSSCLPHTY